MENGGTAAAGGFGIFSLIYLAVVIFMLVAMWKVFTKANQPGWAILIPIYNLYVWLKIAGKPGWWVILMFIPLANLIFGIIAVVGLANNFGKGAGFVLGLIFLPFIFYPILAFSDAQYSAPAAA